MNNNSILNDLRKVLQKNSIDIYLVQGTDEFLNEYVDLSINPRYLVSNFSGSCGEIIITNSEAKLLVDGRYHLQAENEVNTEIFDIVKVPLNQSLEERLKLELKDLIIKLRKSHKKDTINISFDSKTVSLNRTNQWIKDFENDYTIFIPGDTNYILDLINPIKKPITYIKKVPKTISGYSTSQKLKTIHDYLIQNNFDAYFFSNIDEIAYLTNLRGKDFPYSSSFGSYCLCFVRSPKLFLFTDIEKIPKNIFKNNILIIKSKHLLDKTFQSTIKKYIDSHIFKIGVDPNSLNYNLYAKIDDISGKEIKILPLKSPIPEIKSVKTPEEINHIKYIAKRSDSVMRKAIYWIKNNLSENVKISEKNIADKIRELFFENEALDLSFEIIAASGKNSAFIHYTNPDPNKIIKPDELILLDIGAIYEGGYCSDCTRTFIAGGKSVIPDNITKQYYTLVLKSAIAGLSSCFPEYTPSGYIDSIARKPLFNNKLNYNHGTGHGIGINVHESPPRISPSGNDPIKAGMIFSIEPGIYIEGWGGIRFENMVCTEVNNEYNDWINIQPITFAPVETQLIDYKLLSKSEINWLNNYISLSNNNFDNI